MEEYQEEMLTERKKTQKELRDERKMNQLLEDKHNFEKRFKEDDPSLMTGKAYVSVSSSLDAWNIKKKYKKRGILYKFFGLFC